MADCVEVKHGEQFMKLARKHHTYLSSIDIFDTAPIKMKIEAMVVCEEEPCKGKLGLRFVGAKKILALNPTNATTLWRKYGKTAGELIGKEVTLVVEKLKREFAGKDHGVRIQ
jgi:hypothetical protein